MSLKPIFFISSIERVNYRGGILDNKPVNLTLCKSIKKDRLNYYPDNEGIPSIKFDGCDVEWVYNDEAMRDKDFNRVVNGEF
jgi:hypothetical protein